VAAHILLDARKLSDFGIGIYIENLVRGLVELQEKGRVDLQLTLLVPPYFLEAGAPVGVQQIIADLAGRVAFVGESARKYSLSEYFLLAKRQRKHLLEANLYHSPHFTLPFFLGVPSVVTIHDVIHVTLPEGVRHRVFASPLIRSAAYRADHIISVSEASAAKIKETCPRLSVPITVIGNALQEGIEVRPRHTFEQFLKEQFGVTEEYCLFVGNERPHKGFAELAQAWALLARSWGGVENVPTLLAVGNRYSSTAHDIVKKLSLESKVKFLGYVTREALCCLYNGARLVVAPSREEGFGLVPLEALASGVPVLCTPHASYREVCADCAWYSDDFSPEAIARAVEHVLSDEVQRRRKVELGLERIRKYSRVAVAEQTCEVYAQVLERRQQLGGKPMVFRSAKDGQGRRGFLENFREAARRR
jgi:glycosyltransferase involved in cell wall biosynthesis